MRAQITATTQDLKAVDYSDAIVLNLYIVTSDNSETLIDESVSFREMRNKLFQAMYTTDLLSGNFSSISKIKKGSSFHPIKLLGWTDGTGDDQEYEDVCMKLYVRGDSANQIMKDVFKALPLVQHPVSIRIRLKDGRVVTINQGFPRLGGWKSEYMEFAKKFVMKH
jgi:hypothetical protein